MQALDTTLWNRVKPLVDQALTLLPQDRQAFLDQVCTGDEALHAVAQQFLDQLEHLDQSPFMENPAAARFEALVADALDPDSAAEPLEIGPYRTVREIGQGGMGMVFLAERVDGQFEREVALKLIRQEAHTKAAALRFLHERQILARLQHPNIAHLLDGGVADDGRPYFVMEYVEGEPITQYSDRDQLSLKARLGLFLQVCAALQYAHGNLVVHRDVKPSNMLVTDSGQVKLLDFGIAKVLSAGSEMRLTQPGALALTPDYAAPEQVRGEAVTTATDVYALGVLLYELLSGRRPYRVEGASMEAWVRVICETEPLPPSLAVEQAPAAETAEARSSEAVSVDRGTTAARLQRQLAGDLDTIVLRALQKEPTRRYASVEALASDIERYLGGIPILARRDTVPYRLGKFVRRHRFGVGVAVLLVVLVSGFTWRTVVQQRRAEASAARANEVSGFLTDLFTMFDPYSGEAVRGNTVAVGVFLERGAQQIEALSDQGEVQSMLREVLGRVYKGLGRYAEAEGFFRTSLAQRRALYGEESAEVAESMNDLGHLLTLWGGKEDVYGEAEQWLRSALALRKRLLGPEHVEVANTLNNLAGALIHQGNHAEAEALYREALALRKRLLGEEHPDVAQTLNNLAGSLALQGDYAEAETLYREALALRKRLLGDDHPDVAQTLNDLAIVLDVQGKYPETEAMLRDALAIQRKLLGEEHPVIADMLNNLGVLLRTQGNRYAEAEALHRQALAMRIKLLGEEHASVASSLNSLGIVLRLQGNYAEAEALHRKALALYRKLWGEEHPLVATTLTYLALALSNQDKDSEAEALFGEALALQKALLGEKHPQVATTLRNFGALLIDQGAYAEAETMLQTSFETLKQTFGLDHRNTQGVIETFIALYTAWGKPDQAATYQAMRTQETP